MRVFNDLENRVPLEESNDELLDQAWDDHTGASSDAKKVKEAWMAFETAQRRESDCS